MPLTRDIRIKVTPVQHIMIQNKAKALGYKTLSAYIRDTVLNVDYSLEKLVQEIHEIIVKKY